MSGSIRRGSVTLVTAAVVTVGLGACGGVTYTPRGSATLAAPDVTTGPSASSGVTATPSRTVTASPTVTPGPARPTPSASPKPSVPPAPKPTTTPRPVPTKTPRPKPAHPVLRLGDRGPEVLAVQQRLSDLGYWMGEPDGHFGSLTQQAVFALQKTAGLSRDGRVGKRTQRALNDGIRPRTRLDGSGVDIDLERQVLLIVRGGRVRYILNTSTGGGYEYVRKDGSTATARTPKGTFRVGYTVDGPDEGFLGEMWRPRYFNGGYAVHGSPSIPAHPASHGCARVSNSAMDMIWSRDLMPKGSTVLVR